MCINCKQLKGMPESLGGLRRLEVCILLGFRLQRFTTQIRENLSHLRVQVLDLSGCAAVCQLPTSLGELGGLKMLTLRHALFYS